MKKRMVKKLGDKLIRYAERCGATSCSTLGIMHEVEKPECLKRLAQERMQEETQKKNDHS